MHKDWRLREICWRDVLAAEYSAADHTWYITEVKLGGHKAGRSFPKMGKKTYEPKFIPS